MTQYFLKGDSYFIASEAELEVRNVLPPQVFVVDYSQEIGKFFLKPTDGFTVTKLYGDIESRCERVLNTFESRAVSTGVLLSGEKGCGKTLLAKLISIRMAERGAPTILVNQQFEGNKFNQFIQDIDQPAVLIFDEFEKVYRDERDSERGSGQEGLLTLLDGIFPTKKLFVLTSNRKHFLNCNLLNRPGRIFYSLEYQGVEEKFIREYCEDKLNKKEDIKGVLTLSQLISPFNFDMLKALVEEMNRYNEPAAEACEMMNIQLERSSKDVTITLLVDGKEPASYNQNRYLNPLQNFAVGWTEEESEDDDEYEATVSFNPENCVGLKEGDWLFEKTEDGRHYALKITEVKQKPLTYRDYMNLF